MITGQEDGIKQILASTFLPSAATIKQKRYSEEQFIA
jgi:hypothetical protein